MQTAHEIVQVDIRKAKSSARSIGAVMFFVGAAIAGVSALAFSGRADDLQVIGYGLGALLSVMGGAFVIHGLMPIDSHAMVRLMRNPSDVASLTLYKVMRHNAHVATRMEFTTTAGSKVVAQQPVQRADSWLEALYRERPDLLLSDR